MSAPIGKIQGNQGLDYTREIGSDGTARTSDSSETATISTDNQSVSVNSACTYLTISGTTGTLSGVTGVTSVGQQLFIVWGTGCTGEIEEDSSGNINLRNAWTDSQAGTVGTFIWNGSEWLETSRNVKNP